MLTPEHIAFWNKKEQQTIINAVDVNEYKDLTRGQLILN